MKNIVFSITEEYNSNGKEIGKILAKELNIPFYEKEIISIASKKFNISEEIFYSVEEWDLNYFYLPFVFDFGIIFPFNFSSENLLPLQDKTFKAKTEILNELTKKSCVIICKGSNHILKNNPNCIKILVYSKDENRIQLENIKNKSNCKKSKKTIIKKDKKLNKYYSYFTNYEWDNKKTYDIFLNSSTLGIKKCVEILKKLAN